MTRDSSHIVLVGMMGCGKSRIGCALARRIGRRFFDLDATIEAKENRTITSLFAEGGEQAFRQIETRALTRLLLQPPAVIATGGGAFLARVNRQMIARSGVSVYLATRPRVLWQRIAHETHRPLVAGADGQSRLASLVRIRHPLYALATLMVHVGGAERPVAMVDRIRCELGET